MNNSLLQSPYMDGGTAVHRDGDQRGVQKQFTALTPSHYLQDHSKSFNSSCYSLTLLYDDFSFVFIEKDMISISGIKDICSIFDKSHIPFSSYFTTTKKFHDINTFNDSNEMNKYLINDVNIINRNIDLIDN